MRAPWKPAFACLCLLFTCFCIGMGLRHIEEKPAWWGPVQAHFCINNIFVDISVHRLPRLA